MSGRDRGGLRNISGEPPGSKRNRGIQINQVSTDYFETFGLKLLAGRVFAPGGQANSVKVVGDPLALTSATLLLLCVVFAAGAWPAWRASRVDPAISLRHG